ncbi:MAG: insulinase family protein [Acidobacteria bacterium]|nr:insulinase family protein [Acidobacteriota bacterium]MCL5286559.1 insulinase family protein [Acidobacteriota bacterium]
MKRFLKIVFLAVVVVLYFGAAAGVGAQGVEVKTHTLKNGMKILVQEDHSIPNVAVYIFYRIGSRNERPGTTGLSHFFEHMMFNGAKKYAFGEFDRVMEANGGSNNAYTSQNVTVYQDWFPRSALDLIFDLEADRIRDLSFDPKVIESERGVVRNERKVSVENNNFGILNEQLWATAYTAHPYQWPVVGWDVDIVNWKMEDLQNHFRMGYSPSNATMVVSGDVKLEEIVALAEKYIEPIPSHDPPPKVTTQEPEQQGERRVVFRKFAQLPVLMIGFHVPQTNSPEFYPLQVLETILFSGQSSRLYQRLVDKDQLALFVGGGWDWSFDPTLFGFNIRPRAGVEPAKVEQALYEELERLQKGGITDEELEKAKNIRTAEFYRSMKTISGKSNVIGTYEVFLGDYHKLFTAADSYNKVSKEDVQRVAQRFFTEKNRTVATLIPEAPAPKALEKQ